MSFIKPIETDDVIIRKKNNGYVNRCKQIIDRD